MSILCSSWLVPGLARYTRPVAPACTQNELRETLHPVETFIYMAVCLKPAFVRCSAAVAQDS
jgi:hypothetical protein